LAIPERARKVIIYPEAAAAALKTGLGDVYLVYLAVKSFDRAGGGSGLVDCGAIVAIAQRLLGVSKKVAYHKLNCGVGVFWREPVKRGARRMTGLYSHERTFRGLGLDMYASAPVEFALWQLGLDSGKYTSAALRDLMLACVAQWDGSGPLSIECMTRLTGMSESTVRRSLRCAEHSEVIQPKLRINPTFSSVRTYNDPYEAADECRRHNAKYGVRHRVIEREGVHILLTQGPNCYTVDGGRVLRMRNRHRALKEIVPGKPKRGKRTHVSSS
jgi:hypothetical protein